MVIALGSGLTVWMNSAWQLILCWGLLVGLGSGSMALAFAATVTNRWFTERRGLVTGVLTAASASGQLIFLPLLSWIVETYDCARRPSPSPSPPWPSSPSSGSSCTTTRPTSARSRTARRSSCPSPPPCPAPPAAP